MLKWFFLVFGVSIALSALGEEREVVLGYPGDWCPYGCTPDKLENGSIGFAADIVKEIFERQGYRVTVSIQAYSRVQELLRQGKITGIPAAYKQEIPEALYPETALFQAKMCFWGLKTAPRFSDLDSLKKYDQIGVIAGYKFSDKDMADYQNQNLEKFQVLPGNNAVVRLSRMVLSRRIDVFHEEYTLVKYEQALGRIPRQIVSLGCEEPNYGFLAISPEWPNAKELQQIVTNGTRELRADGTLKKLLDRFGLDDWKEDEYK